MVPAESTGPREVHTTQEIRVGVQNLQGARQVSHRLGEGCTCGRVQNLQGAMQVIGWDLRAGACVQTCRTQGKVIRSRICARRCSEA